MILPAILLLPACFGGSGSGTSDDVAGSVSTKPVTLDGSVGDGPISDAMVIARDAANNVVGTTRSDRQARYAITLPVGTRFPVTLTASEGTDLVSGTAPDFTLLSVAVDAASTVVNVTPLTTVMTQTARAMQGGLTYRNTQEANIYATSNFHFGLDLGAVADPATVAVQDSNVAAIIKASEALAESIRRTTLALQGTGSTVSEDAVIAALAGDGVDGRLDGQGGKGSNARIAAVFTAVAAQVHIETITNTLRVNQTDARDRLDNAIREVAPSASGTTESVPVTAAMLKRTRALLAAAQLLAPETDLAAANDALAGLQDGVTPAQVRAVLPAETVSLLENAITGASSGTDQQLQSALSVAKELEAGTLADEYFRKKPTSVKPVSAQGAFEFGSASYRVGESTGAVAVTIRRVGGSDGQVTVDWKTQGVTATFGADYGNFDWTTLTFASGEAEKVLTVAVTPDSLVEGDESFNVVLNNPTGGATLGTTTTAAITIADDDSNTSPVVTAPEPVPTTSPGSFEFAAATYSASESAGSVAVTIRRVGGSDGQATVAWKTQGVTATYGADYGNFDWTTVTFASGESQKTLPVAIKADSLVEGNEVFNVLLSNPTGGATLGQTTSAAITIVDDENQSSTAPVVSEPVTGLVYPSNTTRTVVSLPSLSRPGYLAPITDPVFLTKVTRVTDDAVFGGTNVRHHYSKDQTWNADGSLIKVKGRLLDGKTYKLLRSFSEPTESRWSATDPNKIFGVTGTSFVVVDVATNTTKTVRQFSGFERCYLGPWEGNLSVDDQYAALGCKSGIDATIIVYNIKSNVIESQKTFAGQWANLDWVSMSQTGKYVVITWNGVGGPDGVDTYDRQLNHLLHLTNQSAHADLGIDANGNEVLVKVIPVEMIRLDNGHKTALFSTSAPAAGGGHISCRNIKRPGWAYVSAAPTTTYPGEVFAVKLDGSGTVERFAHHHSSYTAYTTEPQGVVNPYGTKVMFASDWNGNYSVNSYVTEMP